MGNLRVVANIPQQFVAKFSLLYYHCQTMVVKQAQLKRLLQSRESLKSIALNTLENVFQPRPRYY